MFVVLLLAFIGTLVVATAVLLAVTRETVEDRATKRQRRYLQRGLAQDRRKARV